MNSTAAPAASSSVARHAYAADSRANGASTTAASMPSAAAGKMLASALPRSASASGAAEDMTGIEKDLARAFWVTAPGTGEIRAEAAPVAGPGEAIVQALYSGVSRGTESLVFRGAVPASERERMRAPFQQGEFPGPVKYGYSSVGRVVDGPPALADRLAF